MPKNPSRWLPLLTVLKLAACDQEELEDCKKGVNGDCCKISAYNCKLRVSGDQRARHVDEAKRAWPIQDGVEILDGTGMLMKHWDKAKCPGSDWCKNLTEFNIGQRRTFVVNGKKKPYALAVYTPNQSTGWIAFDDVKQGLLDSAEWQSAAEAEYAAFEKEMEPIKAKGGTETKQLEPMCLYEIRGGKKAEQAYKHFKGWDVVEKDDPHMNAIDYLSYKRLNGQYSANLTFNVPGFGLGGVAIDHLPAGIKFRRLRVTRDDGGGPRIQIPIYKKKNGKWHTKDKGMTFVYGYAQLGTQKRFGWMALDALEKVNCKGATASGFDEDEQEQPEPNHACYATCCDGTIQGPVDSVTPDACHDSSKWMCEENDHVLASEWDGQPVWERPTLCWALCNNDPDWHDLEWQDEDCAEGAVEFCQDKGGLANAEWLQCPPWW